MKILELLLVAIVVVSTVADQPPPPINLYEMLELTPEATSD
jgi:hypothetical protein